METDRVADGPIEIRRASAADAPRIARLLHDFNTEFGDPTPGAEALTDHVRRLLEADEMTVLLGGPGPAGLALIRFRASVWTGEPEAHLQEFYVAPALRGQGIGRALLEATLATAREAGATYIDLATGETDAVARALYESCGFTGREGGPDGPRMLFYEREL
jgi:ribosomal protein S18 acetylase RimI-like enzyme